MELVINQIYPKDQVCKRCMRYKYTETKTYGSEIRHPAKHLLSMEKTPMKNWGISTSDPWRSMA